MNDHEAHVEAHREFAKWIREDFYMRYQAAPRWKRRIIDWLL